jgi:hypothetical protein
VNNNFIKLLQEILTTSKTPEEYNARLDELADKLRGSEQAIKYIDDLHRIGLAQKAKEFSPAGFLAHYELMTGTPPPPRVKRWARKIFKAHDEGNGFVLRAYRGSWKTVTLGVVFVSYVISHFPILTNVVVSANDDSAEKITRAVAAIIEHHPEWKRAYPNIVPDSGKWSVEGFFVKDTSMPYEEWVAKRASIIDPTLVGGGIGSTRLNGKHPSGVLYCDDVHDLHNSNSDKERAVVVKTMISVVLKTAIREGGKLKTWVLGVGVPWADDDALAVMADSGQYGFETLPAMEKSVAGAPGAVYIDGRNRVTGVIYTDIVGWWILEDPDRFGIDNIISERSLGRFEFWQMIMMDIKTARVGGLKYHTYRHENIDPTWIHSGGVDFATLGEANAVAKPDPGRDMFSIAYGAKTPFNQLVITDGIIEQCTQAQAEEHMKNSHSKFINWRTGIFEGDGAGEQFWLSFIQRNKGAKWRMEKTGGKSKRYRQEKEMGPWLENGSVLISDEDTDYLNALRKALDDFPDGNNDIRDGLYWLCRCFPEVLILPAPKEGEALPRPGQGPAGLNSAWSHI